MKSPSFFLTFAVSLIGCCFSFITLSTLASSQVDEILVIGTPGARPLDDGLASNDMQMLIRHHYQQISLSQMNRALAAQAAAAAQQRQEIERQQKMECGSKRASIKGALSGCMAGARQNRSNAIQNCPVETSIETSLAGLITVVSAPQATCILQVDAQYEARAAKCEGDHDNAIAALPIYCFGN